MSTQYIDSNGLGTAFSNNSFNGHQAMMRRAYYGCLGYADDLIGQVLDALDDGGVADSTVVSFIGDHGWHLGEHDMWCKMSTLELGTRIPMIIRAGRTPSLATDNLLENNDGVLHQCSLGAAACHLLFMLTRAIC